MKKILMWLLIISVILTAAMPINIFAANEYKELKTLNKYTIDDVEKYTGYCVSYNYNDKIYRFNDSLADDELQYILDFFANDNLTYSPNQPSEWGLFPMKEYNDLLFKASDGNDYTILYNNNGVWIDVINDSKAELEFYRGKFDYNTSDTYNELEAFFESLITKEGAIEKPEDNPEDTPEEKPVEKPEADKDKITDFEIVYEANLTIPNVDYFQWGLCSYIKGNETTPTIAAFWSPSKDTMYSITEDIDKNNVSFRHEKNLTLNADKKSGEEFASRITYTTDIDIHTDVAEDMTAWGMTVTSHHKASGTSSTVYVSSNDISQTGKLSLDYFSVKYNTKSDDEREDNKKEEIKPAEEEKKPEQEEIKKDEEKTAKPEQEEIKKDEEKADKPEQENSPDTPKENNISSDWAKSDIDKAKELNIIEADGNYNYTAAITREEFCEIVYSYIKNVLGLEDISKGIRAIADTDSNAVKQLVGRGIIKGKDIELYPPSPENGPQGGAMYERIIFAPDDYLTREEAATILDRLLTETNENLSMTTNYISFDDSSDISDWADSAIQVMAHYRIMNGVGGNKFAPKEQYTTEQAIATIIRIYNLVK